MAYLTYVPDQDSYPVCILVPQIQKNPIADAYITPYPDLEPAHVLVMDLHYNRGLKAKTSKEEKRTYITNELAPAFADVGVQYVLVADAEYFKVMSGLPKAEPYIGFVVDCPFGPWKLVYVPNYRQMFHNPENTRPKIDQAMGALIGHAWGHYEDPGKGIIHEAHYPKTNAEIMAWLDRIVAMKVPVAIDIEAFSLKHPTAGIGTIAIAWSKHAGIAFPIDYQEIPGATAAPYGRQVRDDVRRIILRRFFEQLDATAMYHSIGYDVGVLIHQLYMDSIIDTQGLLRGMKIMLRNWDCTKLITYLATNSCAGNKLGLKIQAHEFAGNYAMDSDDITDIRNIPLDKLLQYNLVDTLATWFVKEKHWDTMVRDEQLPVYLELFKPAMEDIIQMQLTGMPVDMHRVKEVKALLQADESVAAAKIRQSAVIEEFEDLLKQRWADKMNGKWKKKRIDWKDVAEKDSTFNPNSSQQLQILLYQVLGLPVLDYTKTREPATGAKTLEKLKFHAEDKEVVDLIDALIDHAKVAKILTDFIPSLESAFPCVDPETGVTWHYLFGNFNLGGTLSGRLSSSDPNLQNLPANSIYAKLIKSCFRAPPGWLFVGLDFASLEDRISAVTTKDPNKLKVYTDGYDAHSLRAYSYWTKDMPDIDPNSVESINSIAKKYPKHRSKGKNPTFALTYQGTKETLMRNYGFSDELASALVEAFTRLYKVSIDWVAEKLDQAAKDGYITAAFGLRVRTPLLAQVIRGTSKTPREAEAEGRSAGNALGQSWCLLNSRAGSEFMGKVRQSNRHSTDIRPCAQIHDAQYFMVREDPDVLLYTNEHLVKAVQWQEDPLIANDEVKLGGELSIFSPTWAEEIEIPNEVDTEEALMATIDAYLAKKNGMQKAA